MALDNTVLERLVERLIHASTYTEAPDIDLSQDFAPSRSFYLYVGVSGTVKGVDGHNNAFSRVFTAGWHPFLCTKILSTGNGTTASGLAAGFSLR